MTCSAPSASTAIAATSDESMPPESPMTHVGEAVLAHVVAGAEHERLVDLVHRVEQRLDARRRDGARRGGASLTATSGSARRVDAAARVEQPLAERGPHVEVDDEQVLVELRRARDERRPSRVEHAARRRRRPARPGRRPGST